MASIVVGVVDTIDAQLVGQHDKPRPPSGVLASQHSAALVCIIAPAIVRYDGGAGVSYAGVARGLTTAEASSVGPHGKHETVPMADAGLRAQPVTEAGVSVVLYDLL